MVKAVREHKRILQTGSHYRSSPANRFACELVRNGRIGKIQRILTQVAENNAVSPGPGWQPMPVPEGFDYEMWLGPAPQALTTSIAVCIVSASSWTTQAARRPTSGPTPTISPSGAWARTTPGRLRSRTRERVAGEGQSVHDGHQGEFPCAVRQRGGTDLPNRKTGFWNSLRGHRGLGRIRLQGRTDLAESLKTSRIGPNEIHLPVSNPRGKRIRPGTTSQTMCGTSSTASRAARTHRVGRGGASHSHGLPLGQYRHALGTQTAMGPSPRAVRQRR